MTRRSQAAPRLYVVGSNADPNADRRLAALREEIETLYLAAEVELQGRSPAERLRATIIALQAELEWLRRRS